MRRRRLWRYRDIPVLIRAWTWKHDLCAKTLLFFGWPTWKAYETARRWLG